MNSKKLTRRGFLGGAAGAGFGSLGLSALAARGTADAAQNLATACPCQSAAEWKSTSDQPPRKVIIGTVMRPFWGKYPGLDHRLRVLTDLLDNLQGQSRARYGRGVDLAVLPETAVTGEARPTGHVMESSFPLEGPVQDSFSASAREHRCYIVVPLFLIEDRATKLCSNAAVLFDRQGDVAGIYRKLHLVVDDDGATLEHGCMPGTDVPVFQCDFGKLGMQICYDMDFDYGWRELARKGAEIVAWPTQSPQRARPVPRAIDGHYFIVSSTWRKDACIFEPTGKIVSEITWKPEMGSPGDWDQTTVHKPIHDNILVEEIDLSYAILPYSGELKNGQLFAKTFGERAGFRYYDDDDRGIFWSNDPKMTVRQMIASLNLTEEQDELRHDRSVYHNAGVPGY